MTVDTPKPSPGPHRDGRVARGERTRERIVAAHAALLREGELRPTAGTIADRAGVSVRALWQHFKDLEGLFAATTVYWFASDAELAEEIDPRLPRAERIESFCSQRVARMENLAPAVRAAALGEPFSAALARSRSGHLHDLRRTIESVFAPEIEAAGDRHEELVMSLVAATTGRGWLLLRDDFGMDVDHAGAVLRRTVAALLGAG